MLSRTRRTIPYTASGLSQLSRQPYRCISCSLRLAQSPAQSQSQSQPQDAQTTHFGFETVEESKKASRVGAVFSSVAKNYDTMNDLMSFYIHRLWKDRFVRSINPGIRQALSSSSSAHTNSPGSPTAPEAQRILDIAGGTGDIAVRLLDHATLINNDQHTNVIISDINPEMLAEGRKRMAQTAYANTGRISYLEANAEDLSAIESSSIDLYTVAFGIRNFTSIPNTLREAYRVLKPGGVFACLEFSKVGNPLLNTVYKRWSFGAIPLIGQLVAGDRDSYQYLVESIERFPGQREFEGLIKGAGFMVPRETGNDMDNEEEGRGWENLTGGVACIHKGVKPVLVHFPGAVNSKFTTQMSFQQPSTHPAIPTYRVMDSDGVIVDKERETPDVPDEEILTWYKNMLTVSIMDLIMFDAQRQGRLSFYMVSAGEEGIAIGSASALHPSDVIFAQYRETGVFQQRGFTLAEFMNQLFANCKDGGKGRNMPVHYGSSALNIHTISSPLATQIPQAAGAAYALKLQSLQNPNIMPRICACYFGEGAASEGDFHAALNIAATRSCPVVFICRNNGYAISTPTLEQYRGDGIASRGVGYGIDTIRVDGNDIFAVREVTKKAREMALQDGGKPVLIEAMSYRVSHHSTSDDSFAYRARVEVEDWKRRDNPITRLRKWMQAKGLWDEEKEKEARGRLRREVLKAFAAAEREKKPPLREMFTDVYEEVTEEGRSQMVELGRLLDTYPAEYDVEAFEGGREGL